VSEETLPRGRRLPARLLLFLVVAAVLAGAGVWIYQRVTGLPPYEPPSERIPPPPVEGELRLVAMGDWGSAKRDQAIVLDAIERKAREVGGIHAGLLLGDNFYSHGVSGVDDERWVDVFEHPFDKAHLALVPFYAVLGNHDYDGNPEAQVAYTARSRGHWRMPSEYYRVDLPEGAPPLLTVLGLDTNRQFAHLDEETAWLEKQLVSLEHAPQIVLAMGHHPIASYAEAAYRVETQVKERIRPLLLAHPAVDLYLCGHSHCMELIDDEGQWTAVVGSGGKDLYGVKSGPGSVFHASVHGFAFLRVGKGSLDLEFVDTGGRVLDAWHHTRKAR
jgi:tartrate-resistant acid phosphatase type 5